MEGRMLSGIGAVNAGSLSAVGNAESTSRIVPNAAGSKGDAYSEFGDLFRDSIGQVNELEQQSRAAVDGLMRGTGVDVHQAMIAAEKANAAFELALAMRNKAVQCYQSVMSMQF